jgi:hypothetical protein
MATPAGEALLCPECKTSRKLYEFGAATYSAFVTLFADPALDERDTPHLMEIGTWGR